MNVKDIIAMSTGELRYRLLEENLAAVWKLTKTKRGCLHIVDSLHDWQLDYTKGSEEYRLINDARDLAFTKGQMMQLVDNQRAYVGDL